MKHIEVKVLNPEVVADAEKMMVAMARLTQRGHTIGSMEDLEALLDLPYKNATADNMTQLPHPTIQKFGVINIALVGISRRFLGQITRHQNEIKFMSSSCQYSDYTDKAEFVVPYEVTAADETTCNFPKDWHKNQFIKSCEQSKAEYEAAVQYVGHDAASYMLPQSLRGTLIMSATPYQFKHMIRQRTCLRNTLETQYVMLRVWEELHKLGVLFEDCGPDCMNGTVGACQEGSMSCREFPDYANPTLFLNDRFHYLREELY